jgi:hypothetical protein
VIQDAFKLACVIACMVLLVAAAQAWADIARYIITAPPSAFSPVNILMEDD